MYTQVYAGIRDMQESRSEIFDRRRKRPASDPPGEEEKQPRRKSGSQRSHDLKREKKGEGQEEGPQAPQAVPEVKMGLTASRPPPNLMRAGMSPRDYPPSSRGVSCIHICIGAGRAGRCEYIPGYLIMPALLFTTLKHCRLPCAPIPAENIQM